MKNQSEIIIIGAGLTGLCLAIGLKESGIDSLIIDAHDTTNPNNHKTGIIQENILASIANLDFQKSHIREVKEIEYLDLKDTKIFSTRSERKENLSLINFGHLISILKKHAQQSGINFKHNTLARNLISENNIVKGVETEKEKFFSELTVITTGFNSKFIINSGLKKGFYSPEELILFFEETISLKRIKEEKSLKFNLNLTNFNDLKCFGYLNTARDYISLGVGASLKDLKQNQININDIIEECKINEAISPLINGGETTNINSYTLPNPSLKNTISNPQSYFNNCILGGAITGLTDINSDVIPNSSLENIRKIKDIIINCHKKNDFRKEAMVIKI